MLVQPPNASRERWIGSALRLRATQVFVTVERRCIGDAVKLVGSERVDRVEEVSVEERVSCDLEEVLHGLGYAGSKFDAEG